MYFTLFLRIPGEFLILVTVMFFKNSTDIRTYAHVCCAATLRGIHVQIAKYMRVLGHLDLPIPPQVHVILRAVGTLSACACLYLSPQVLAGDKLI
jgi:hypothetical protein